MANILDIRRRIRSVKNTRQITKAMQMVSAAKLRRAQERALAARPYAQMLTNVLKSLVSRAEVYDPVTGEARNPLLIRREEKTALLIVVSGEKGLAGAFNSNILKAAARFLQSKQGKNIDDPWTLYPIGEEPTVHRIRFIDLYGEGKPRLVVTPLMGRNATQPKNWMDGSPVRILAYAIPKDPTKDRWLPEVISEGMHVVHNFAPVLAFKAYTL